MQGIRQRRHLGHRRRTVPGGSEIRCGGTGFPNHPADPGKGGVAGPTLEDGTGAQT